MKEAARKRREGGEETPEADQPDCLQQNQENSPAGQKTPVAIREEENYSIYCQPSIILSLIL